MVNGNGLKRGENPIGEGLIYESRDGGWNYCIERIVTESMASVRCLDEELRNYPTYYFRNSDQFRVVNPVVCSGN